MRFKKRQKLNTFGGNRFVQSPLNSTAARSHPVEQCIDKCVTS